MPKWPTIVDMITTIKILLRVLLYILNCEISGFLLGYYQSNSHNSLRIYHALGLTYKEWPLLQIPLTNNRMYKLLFLVEHQSIPGMGGLRDRSTSGLGVKG